MRTFFLLITVFLTLTGCNKKIKETIGMVTTGPNEYLVKRNKPLEMPPHYELTLVKTVETTNNDQKGIDKLNEGEKALINEIGR